MEDEKTYKEKTRELLEEIRRKSQSLYDTINEAKSFHLLTGSHYMLYSMLASRQKKKLGLKG